MENDSLWHSFTKDLKKLNKKNKVFLEHNIFTKEVKLNPKEFNSDFILKYQLHYLSSNIIKATHSNDLYIKNFIKNFITYDDKLDLHGLSLDRSYDILKSFIIKNFISRKRNLLIITGKGKLEGAAFQGKLRTEVPRWLNIPELKQLILAYEQAPPQMGGKGAFVLFLRKNKSL